MKLLVDRKGTVETFKELIAGLEKDPDVGTIIILACDDNEFAAEKIDHILQNIKKPVLGAIFPMILFEKESLQKGTIIAGIKDSMDVHVIKEVSADDKDLDKEVSQLYTDNSLIDKTMFVFVDGFSKNISLLNETMFNYWGLQPNYVGGGAGSLSFIQKPCIMTNQGLLSDAVVFGLGDIKSGIGVAHGWKTISDQLKVTDADRNVIKSINYRPAVAVYKEIVEELSGRSFSREGFFEVSKGYPIGIMRMAEEVIVRDPIAVDGDTLICIGEVPLNSTITILNGDTSSLLMGAETAKKLAGESYFESCGENNHQQTTTFFIDCISRVLFLGDAFNREVEIVKQEFPLFGALTIGEIANTGNHFLEFYNKTSVVCLLED